MIRSLRHPAFLLLLRLVVGGIFLWSSLDKITHPFEFSRAVHAYQILPLPLVNPFSILLAWLELVAGVLLVLGLLPRGAALVTSGMTATFLVAIALVLLRGIEIDCGCFQAEGGGQVDWNLWLRDWLLLAGTFWLLLWEDGRTTGLQRWLSPEAPEDRA